MSSVQRQRGLSRIERAARARRRRARAHLARVQHRGSPPQRGGSLRVPTRTAAVLVLAVSLGAGALAAAAWRRDATLDSLNVLGLRRVSPAEIAAQSGLERGGSLAELDVDALRSRLAEHGWIERARTLSLPTGRVLVAVDERQPVALLTGETTWAVDASGVPFAPLGEAAADGLPRLAAAWTPEPGEPSPELAEAVELARRLPELGLPSAEEVGVSAPGDPQGFWLRLPGLPARIVLGRSDLEVRLKDLARLLDAALPALAQAQQVDLRFRDQAVLDVPLPGGAEQAAAMHGSAEPSTTRPAG